MSGVKKSHWETVYATKASESVSWYQPHAKLSLDWIQGLGVARDVAIIDVGGGASTLADDLLAAGYQNLTILDLSGAALNLTLKRLGPDAAKVTWREADVTTTALPQHAYDIWHDRAVFHFLTEHSERQAYTQQLLHAVKPGGHVIIATFGLNGPTRCSGLPIVQYSAEALQKELGPQFQLLEHANERHVTPSGAEQSFIYCHFIKGD